MNNEDDEDTAPLLSRITVQKDTQKSPFSDSLANPTRKMSSPFPNTYLTKSQDNDAVNAAAAIAFSSSMHECLSNSQIKKRLSEEAIKEEVAEFNSPNSFTSSNKSSLESWQAFDYKAIASFFMSSKRRNNNRPTTSQKSGCIFYNTPIGKVESRKFEGLDLMTKLMEIKSIASRSDVKLDDVEDFLKSSPFWIDYCSSSFSELGVISKLFAIHPLTTEDIASSDTREKCETFENYTYISIRSFDADQYSWTYLAPINISIIVFQNCVITFHASPIPHVENILTRIKQLGAYGLNFSPDWINYALVDDITDTFMPLIRFIEYEVGQIDDLVLILKEQEQSDMLKRIGIARKQVLLLMRLLSSKPDVLKTILKRVDVSNDVLLYLSDIQDHCLTMVQNLAHYEKTLARSHSNYLAQISIEITQASNKTNDVVMRMTVLASILIPLNVVTGIWGMNVNVPGQHSDSLYWFFGIITGMICLALFMFHLVRKQELF